MPAMPPSPDTLAFIGGGNMARSLIGGLIAAGNDPTTIRVADPNADCRDALAADFGVSNAPVQLESVLLDRRMRWRAAGNVWHNSAIRTTLYLPIHGLRRLLGK